jgi:DNA-binding transcriptional ArsR family regulator
MGTSKHLGFEVEINEIAAICKALGNPTRLQILTLLWKKNNRTCGEIVLLIPLAQSTISKHLLELKKMQLLSVKNIGKKTIYSIEVDKIQILKKYLTHFLLNKSFSNEEKTISTSRFETKKEEKQNLKQYNYQFPNKKKDTN